jgi:RNA polymerase sigma-70 factor, ECF subfamily
MDSAMMSTVVPKPEEVLVRRESAAADLVTWVRWAQEDDVAAFEEVVRRTIGLARKTAFPLLRPHQVDDAVQEAFLMVYQKLHHLQKPEAFQAWLARIVIHVCYAMKKKTPITAEPTDVGTPDSTAQVATRLDLRAALDQLREDDRNVLIMRSFLKLSYEEIAYATRLPVGTVRSKLHYGRKKLKELMAQEG